MRLPRHAEGHEEPKWCDNCYYFFNGNGHPQIKNKNGIRLCHNLHDLVDRRHQGLDCKAWKPEE